MEGTHRTDCRSILVPLDGSPLSEQALSRAVGLAQESQSAVILLHVRNAPLAASPVPNAEACAGWKRLALRCARRKAEDYLHVHQRELRLQGLDARALMCDQAPVEAILEVATRESVDLIVMSGRAHDGFSRWHVGNVAGTVAQQSPCPVLLMPSAAHGERG